MQAPIGPAATPALAAAVSEAGGIGSLGASWTEAGRAARPDPRDPEGHRAAVLREPRARVRAGGAPRDRRGRGRRGDLVLVGRSAPTSSPAPMPAGASWSRRPGRPTEAHAAVDAGCDAVMAQGVEAGGHVQGEIALLALVGELSRSLAGPRHRRRRHRRCARRAGRRSPAGAVGVAMGTRFLATPGGRRPSRLGRAAARGVGSRHGADRAASTAAGRTRRTASSATAPTGAGTRRAARRPGSRPGEGEVVARPSRQRRDRAVCGGRAPPRDDRRSRGDVPLRRPGRGARDGGRARRGAGQPDGGRARGVRERDLARSRGRAPGRCERRPEPERAQPATATAPELRHRDALDRRPQRLHARPT